MAERNIDFREAKSKGLVAPNKIAEQELIKIAGGQDVFKPESWWNEQLKKQIDAKNFQEQSGSKLQIKGSGILSPQWVDAPMNIGGVQSLPPGNLFGKPREGIDYRYVPTFKDVTTDVLNLIKAQSKKSVETMQAESGKFTASRKRLSRATGGLLAGTSAPMDSLSTGPMLGDGAELGTSATLGRRTRI